MVKDSLTRVSALISDNEHIHEDNEAAIIKNHSIDRSTKEKINHFVEMGRKPSKVLIELRKIGFEPPTKLQLYNYIKTLKKEKLSSTIISLNDLKEWAEKYSSIPST